MFTFFLAHKLGMTRRELLSRADSRELSEWMAYFSTHAEKDVMQILEAQAIQSLHASGKGT